MLSSAGLLFQVLCPILLLFLIYILISIKNYVSFLIRIGKLPGPKRHPIFGNVLDIVRESEYMFELLRKWGAAFYPVYTIMSYPVVSINLNGPEDIEKVIATTKHSSKSSMYKILHAWLGTGLLTSDGNKWQQRRKLLTPTFHFNILQQFIGIFHKESRKLVENLESTVSNSINVVPYITQFALCSINETSMGTVLDFNDETDKQYKNAVLDVGKLYIYRLTHPWLYFNFVYYLSHSGWKELKFIKILHNFTNKVISRKLNETKEQKIVFEEKTNSKRKRLAMLDLLINVKNEGLIDIDGIREEIDTFMFEGHDTTSMSLCFTLMTLALQPHIQEGIVKEINEIIPDPNIEPTIKELNDLKYLECCIKESLRLYPSVPLISRIADEDITLTTGGIIPKDSTINIHIYDLHRNPNLYPDPEKFDPDRFLIENVTNRHPFAYIPFSAGPRNCIGQKFAMLEMKIALSAILRNYILEPVDTPDTIRLIPDLVLRSKEGIKVKFIKRN